MGTFQDLPILFFAEAAAWEAWLAQNHEQPTGVWLKFAKKASGIASVQYAGALDVALCYGWIDGQSRSLDERYYLQKFTPRRPKSLWSKINIGKVEALIAAGRMQPAGFAAITAAQADGRWDAAYDPPTTATPPSDLLQAFADHPSAAAFFETLNKTNQYAVIWRLQTAPSPASRARRLEKLLAMLEAGKQIHT